MRTTLALLALATATAASTGCAMHGDDMGTDGTDGSSDGDDGDTRPEPDPEPLHAAGAYQVRSDVSVTVEALLPQPAADLVGTLRDFETNPAQTIFDQAEAAGVPAVGEIRDALPGYVEDKLEGWINGHIAGLTINGVPITAVAGTIVDYAELALTRFALDSELTLEGGTATHTLTTLDLTPAGLTSTFDLAALPADVITARTTYATSVRGTGSSATTSLTLGDHTFGMAYGEYMWRAVEAEIVVDHGMTIREALGAAVSCPSLAHTIASKCYAGYCVGHETQLLEICERGLDEIVDRAHAKVAALRFDAVHFAAGTATLVDADRDGTGDALTAGVWTAEINASQGLRHVPATFTATR